MSDHVYRLQAELESFRKTNESLVERVRARDMADAEAAAAAKPKENYALKRAQQSVDQTLGNTKAVEELRAAAWVDWSHAPGSNFYQYLAPSDGSWPEGMTAVAYVRKFHGLNDEGTALAGEKPAEPEQVKLSQWIEAALAKAREGK